MKRIWNYITQDDFPTETCFAIWFVIVSLGFAFYYSLQGY